MNKKVAFLINSLDTGGAQKILLTLYDEFIAQDLMNDIICLENKIDYKLNKSTNVILLSNKKPVRTGIFKFLSIPYFAFRLLLLVRKEKIDIIVSHLYRSNYINVLAQIFGSKHKSIIVNHMYVSFEKNKGLLGKTNLFLIRYLYAKANALVLISKKMLLDIKKHLKNHGNEIVIYNPHNKAEIEKKTLKPITEFKFKKSKYYLISVGRLIARKRVEDIIEAMSKLTNTYSNLELIILGDGPEKLKLEKLSDSLNLSTKIHFMGNVANPYKFISHSDIFILSSESEGLPNVIIEAMYCKTAVISTDCPTGPSEILNPKNNNLVKKNTSFLLGEYGILYPIADIDLLVESIKFMIDNKTIKSELEKKAYKRANDFNKEKIANDYIELIDNLSNK